MTYAASYAHLDIEARRYLHFNFRRFGHGSCMGALAALGLDDLADRLDTAHTTYEIAKAHLKETERPATEAEMEANPWIGVTGVWTDDEAETKFEKARVEYFEIDREVTALIDEIGGYN